MKTLDPTLRDEAVRRIREAVSPEAIYLYGSHAYGEPHPDSDVDFLVVLPEGAGEPRRATVAAYHSLRGLFLPAEIRVVTRRDFERLGQWPDSVERAVREKGQLLYATEA